MHWIYWGGVENYFLAQGVVLRTIDILFTKPNEGGGGERDGGGKTSLLIHQNFIPIVKTIKVKIYNSDVLIITCIIFKQQ